jgi:hypothetical protein
VPALITTLIDRPDQFEVVRDQIAAILLLEQAQQQALATAASKDPALWKLRIFTERANPWDEWPDAEEPSSQSDIDATPIVNVSFDSDTFDKSKGNVISQQRADGVFNVDVYGRGVSASDGGTGHVPGDQTAALEAARALRLVRSILLSAQYVNLGLRGIVADRWVGSRTSLQPARGDRPVQHVMAARLALQVSYLEFAPQWDAVGTLELVSTSFTRADNGEIFIASDFTIGA